MPRYRVTWSERYRMEVEADDVDSAEALAHRSRTDQDFVRYGQDYIEIIEPTVRMGASPLGRLLTKIKEKQGEEDGTN